jgi:hypothetical protein
MTTNSGARKQELKKDRYIEVQQLRLKLVHKEVSNIASGTMGTTWKERTVQYFWNITRPQAGMLTLSTTCPACGVALKIDVTSTVQFKAEIKKARKNGTVMMIVSLFLGLGAYLFNRLDLLTPTLLCLSGGVLCFLFGLIEMGTNGGRPWGLVATGSLLSGGLINENAAGPHSCHYIDSIESLQD